MRVFSICIAVLLASFSFLGQNAKAEGVGYSIDDHYCLPYSGFNFDVFEYSIHLSSGIDDTRYVILHNSQVILEGVRHDIAHPVDTYPGVCSNTPAGGYFSTYGGIPNSSGSFQNAYRVNCISTPQKQFIVYGQIIDVTDCS